MGRKVMGYWDCIYCGQKKIEGTRRDCPNCSNARGSEVKFYMDPNNIVYLDEEQAKDKGKGADWLCPYCDKLNPVSATSCISCGAAKEESVSDYFTKDIKEPVSTHTYNQSYTYNEEDYNEYEYSTLEESKENIHSKNTDFEYSNEDKSDIKKKPTFYATINFNPEALKIAGIILAIFLFITGMIFAFMPKTKNFTLTGHYWERNINIESYETVNESDWYVPDGGRVQYTREEIKDYEPVLDHYETITKTRRVKVGSHIEYIDNGDGSFDEKTVDDYGDEEYTEQEPVYKDEPIYATKYYYEIERWIPKRTVSTNGYDHNPIWGEVVLADNEREINRGSKYYVFGYYKQGKDKKIKVNEDMWEKLSGKREYVVKANTTGIIEIIE